MTTLCLKISLVLIVLLGSLQEQQQEGANAATVAGIVATVGVAAVSATVVAAATTAGMAIPHIRDDMITPTQALESAIICESLLASSMQQDNNSNNNSNSIQITPPPQFTTLMAYLYDRSADDDDAADVADSSSNECSFWILNSSERLVVAFRGSDKLADATVNVNQVPLGPTGRVFTDKMIYTNVTDNDKASPVETDVLVHSGFNDAVFSVYDSILQTIEPLLTKTTPYDTSGVSVIGHGLGGAHASLFATYYAFHHPTTAVRVQTFGQPRCGNYGFKILMESIPNLNVWRLVNQQDVIPRVPFVNYHHAGHLIWRKEVVDMTMLANNDDGNGNGNGNGNTATTTTTTAVKEEDSHQTVSPGFFRTIGDVTLGYDGIADISMAVCTQCDDIGEQFLIYHDLTTGILPWLMEAVMIEKEDSTNHLFPIEFSRLDKLQ